MMSITEEQSLIFPALDHFDCLLLQHVTLLTEVASRIFKSLSRQHVSSSILVYDPSKRPAIKVYV